MPDACTILVASALRESCLAATARTWAGEYARGRGRCGSVDFTTGSVASGGSCPVTFTIMAWIAWRSMSSVFCPTSAARPFR